MENDKDEAVEFKEEENIEDEREEKVENKEEEVNVENENTQTKTECYALISYLKLLN